MSGNPGRDTGTFAGTQVSAQATKNQGHRILVYTLFRKEFVTVGRRHDGCTCFDLLEDIGRTAGTEVIVFTTGSGDAARIQGTLIEDVTPDTEVLQLDLPGAGRRIINVCCALIVAIQEPAGDGGA